MGIPENKKSIPGFSKTINVPARLSKDMFNEFEIELSRAVLKGKPNDLEALSILGNALTRSGRHEEALEADQKIAFLIPDDPVALYNISCDLSNLGRLDEALEYLKKAIRFGYNDFGFIEKDPDMKNLRTLPGYKRLLSRYKRAKI